MNNIVRATHKIDATGQTIGRLSTKIVGLLRGKLKPEFQPHLDLGDIVEIINITKVKFTGKKLDQKTYKHHSGYPGGLRTKKMKDVFASNPGDVLKRAVREMLPPTRLRTGMLKRLIIR